MSELRIDTLANRLGAGPTELTGQWAARAYAAVNGTGTLAVRDSNNVSSVSDDGTGAYTLNYTNDFAVAGEYACVTGKHDQASQLDAHVNLYSYLVGNISSQSMENNAAVDTEYVAYVITGALA